MEGLTGRMKFYEGRRTEFELDILQLSDGGLSKVRRNMTTTPNKLLHVYQCTRHSLAGIN